MALRRFRFTIRQLVALIAVCAVVFALLRSPAAILVFLIGPVLPGFFIGRANGGTGMLGGTISCCLSFVGCVIVSSGYYYLSGNLSGGFLLGAIPSLFFVFIITAIWGFVVSAFLYGMIKSFRIPSPQGRPHESSCGAIVWLGLDDGKDAGVSAPGEILWLDEDDGRDEGRSATDDVVGREAVVPIPYKPTA